MWNIDNTSQCNGLKTVNTWRAARRTRLDGIMGRTGPCGAIPSQKRPPRRRERIPRSNTQRPKWTECNIKKRRREKRRSFGSGSADAMALLRVLTPPLFLSFFFVAALTTPRGASALTRRDFPEGFVFGAGSSAYQVLLPRRKYIATWASVLQRQGWKILDDARSRGQLRRTGGSPASGTLGATKVHPYPHHPHSIY